MSELVAVNKEDIQSIADIIRDKTGDTGLYSFETMASTIASNLELKNNNKLSYKIFLGEILSGVIILDLDYNDVRSFIETPHYILFFVGASSTDAQVNYREVPFALYHATSTDTSTPVYLLGYTYNSSGTLEYSTLAALYEDGEITYALDPSSSGWQWDTYKAIVITGGTSIV